MKKLLTIVSFFSFAVLFAQHEVAKKMQELERLPVTFNSYKVLNVSNKTTNEAVLKTVDDATFAKINVESVNLLIKNKPEYLEIEIPYNNKTVVLDLYKVTIFSEGFHVDTDKGKNVIYEKGVYYRGIIKGNYTSVVAMNFFNGEMNGVISCAELNNLVVGKLKFTNNTDDYIIYSDAKLKVLNDYKCSLKVDETATMDGSNKSPSSVKCVTMYFEVDYDLYMANNNSTIDTTNWMTSVFNNVQTIFTNDGITTSLKSLYIWTSQDPYEGIGTTSGNYLYKFNEVRPVFDGDLGQLVGIDPGGLGGVAVGINGLCSQNNFSYSDVFFDYNTVPTYSWTINVITHELGHLLGSPHTHACIWNGNNTSIDGCGQQAGYNEGTCATGPIPSTTDKGTIMSYCHLISGIGINLSNGFGPQPANLILSRISASNCLSTDCIATCINTIASISVSAISTTSATINWVESGLFTEWKVRVFAFGSTPGNWNVVTTNSYAVSGLTPNTYYVVDVSPNCSMGLEIIGRKLMFVTATSFCDGITFADSGGVSGNYTNLETVIRTIVPNVASNNIAISFSAFSLELDYDYLYVYNGNSTTAPLLNPGGSTGTDIPGPFTSSATDGSLTVKFYSDQGVVAPGFIANISCVPNLSVNNYNGFIDFSYFPNPTSGKVAITSKTIINKVEVYNITGQLLLDNEIKNINTNVDISSFANGTYFFKLKFEDNKEANFKVIRR